MRRSSAHLSRAMNVAEAGCHPQIEDFARRFAGRVYGLVIHDHPMLAENPRDYVRAAQELNARLQPIQNCPWLFVEYAAGVELAAFLRFVEAIRAAGSHQRLCGHWSCGHPADAQRLFPNASPGGRVRAQIAAGADSRSPAGGGMRHGERVAGGAGFGAKTRTLRQAGAFPFARRPSAVHVQSVRGFRSFELSDGNPPRASSITASGGPD